MLREQLIAKQSDLGLSNTEFARLLKLSRPTWVHAKLGSRPIRRTVALAAMRTFPELTADAVSFLLSDVPNSTNEVPNGKLEEQLAS